MKYADIDREVTRLQRELWKHRLTLLGRDPVDPLDAIDPALAARVLGYEFVVQQELGRFGDRSNRFEIAGMIDRPRNKIAVAMKFGPQVQRFTAAHEVAHAMLHPAEVMHRDLPVKGVAEARQPRKPVEREADFGGACLLIPAKQLRKIFQENFGVANGFRFDDDAAFWLSPTDPEPLLYGSAATLDRALALARAPSYGGRRIVRLDSFFKVSPTSMAIRIEQLGLIRH